MQQGHAVALDHVTGQVKWRSAANDFTGTLFSGPPLVLFSKRNGSKRNGAVTALAFFTGKPRWTVDGAGPVQVNPGPNLGDSHSTVLLADQREIRALDERTGKVVWRVAATSPEYTVRFERFSGDKVILLHSPSEGFLGNVYTANDAASGREVWRLQAGHGDLLGEKQGGLIFDLRDWQNLLDEGGTIQTLRIDWDTGQRSPLTLRVGVPNAREWQTEPGTLQLGGAGGTWVVAVRARDGATRLIYTPKSGNARLWTLPSQKNQVGGFSLRPVTNGVLLGSPDGSVTRFEHNGNSRSILPAGGGVPFISERLYGIRAIVCGDQTAFLDENERVRLRVPGRADAWTTGGDLETVMVLEGTRLSAYAWPPSAHSRR